MDKYLVPISWTMCGTVKVEANSLEEAMKKAEDKFYGTKDMPDDSEYLCDSLEMFEEDVCIDEGGV